jgi:hypothetical protein
VPGWLAAYGVLQFLLLTIIGCALQWLGGGVGLAGSAMIVVLVLWGTGTMGALFESKPWAVRLELLRLGVSAAVALVGTSRFQAPWLFPMAACFLLSGAALVLLWPRSIPRAVEPPQPSR